MLVLCDCREPPSPRFRVGLVVRALWRSFSSSFCNKIFYIKRRMFTFWHRSNILWRYEYIKDYYYFDKEHLYLNKLREHTTKLLLTFNNVALSWSGLRPTCDRILIPLVFCERSAKDKVIFLCVKLSVEWGRKLNFVRNTACPCKPVPCRINRWLWSPCKAFILKFFYWVLQYILNIT